MHHQHIIVIGGGISGLAAARELRQAGAQVTLVEARPYLGGRLTSHTSGSTPTPFDNGPHLFLSTYRHTRRLFRQLGVDDGFQFPFPGGVSFLLPDNLRGRLTPLPLPAPLNLAGGLLSFRLLPRRARWRTVQSSKLLINTNIDPQVSAAAWLEEHSRAEERELFWLPLLRAALNAPPEAVSVRDLQIVLKEGFAQGLMGGRLGYATRPLAEIFDVKTQAALADLGVRVILKTQAIGAKIEGGRLAGVYLKPGEMISCNGVIAALPPWALRELLAAIPLEIPELRLAEWQSNSIATLYLWAEKRPWLEAYTCLPGRNASWVFDYVRLWGKAEAPLGVMLEKANDKGAYDLSGALQELETAFPQLRGLNWVWSLMQERRATPLRPKALWGKTLPRETPISNLFLTGDWLDPLLPPTVEAAVRAGREAGKFLNKKKST